MSVYRISRNIEASFISFLQETLTETPYLWNDIQVIKGFNKAYELPTPTIAVRAENTIYDKVEVGSNSFVRTVQVFVDIFASDDGMRLDLKDCIIEILKDGLVYNEYTITKSGRTATSSATPNGRIRIQKIDDKAINFNVDDKSKLDVHDRYRHLLTLTVSIGRVE
jgi:hypothetical protein